MTKTPATALSGAVLSVIATVLVVGAVMMMPNSVFSSCAAGLVAAATVVCIPPAGVHGQNAEALESVLRDAQRTTGLAIQLGSGDGALSSRLAAGGRLLVHALEPDPAKVTAARQRLHAEGLSGVVTIEAWDAETLPFPDRLANLLVAANPGRVAEAELRRVLAPNGSAWVRREEGWVQLQKTWPKDLDEWTHSRHGADGNMVSQDRAVGVPLGLKWVAGPAQDPQGKKWYYDHVLLSANGRNIYMYENAITARDAFNGVRLWSRELQGYSFRETGTRVPQFLLAKAKLGGRTSKVRPVAVGDRVYLAAEGRLLALDAVSGQTVTDLAAVQSPRELLVQDDTLVVADQDAVRAYYLPSNTLRWELPLAAERIVAGDGRFFCLASNVVMSGELATGKERWRITDERAEPAATLTYHAGCLVLEKSTWRDDTDGCGVLVYAGEDGRALWQKDYPTDQTHYQEARAFFARDLLWLQTAKDKIVGLDPRSGEARQTWASRGKHCATPVATERFFIAPECEFTDLETGAREQARMFKSACRLPFIPANGLLYTFPVQCECFPMLRGYMALAPTPAPRGDLRTAPDPGAGFWPPARRVRRERRRGLADVPA